MKYKFTYEELYHLYIEEGYSTVDIGKRYKVSDTYVRNFMKKFNIPRRDPKVAGSTEKAKAKLPKPLRKEENPRWEERKKRKEGYKIYKPNHPAADLKGLVYERILVMEEHLGRYLNEREWVKCINGDKFDSRIENLLLKAYKEQSLKQTYTPPISYEDLYNNYIIQEMSRSEIGRLYNISSAKVKTALAHYGIQIRNIKEQANTERNKKRASTEQIGKRKINHKYSVLKKGYVKIYMPDHPEADKNGRILEHRYVMECILGRPLLKEEDVHHIDGTRNNNEPDNLQAMNHRDHAMLHGRGYKKHETSPLTE